MGWCLWYWNCWKTRRVLFVCRHWTYLKIVKSSKRHGNIFAGSKDWIQAQVKILPVKHMIFQVGHVIRSGVQVLCAYSRKFFTPHLHSPLQVGGIWNSRQMVVQKLLFLRQQVPGCQRNFLEFIVISWTRSLTFTITQSCPNGRNHTIPSLET